MTAASNTAIPGLHPVRDNPPNLRVFLGCRPPDNANSPAEPESLVFASSILTESGLPVLKIFASDGGTLTHLVYADEMEFWLDEEGGNIWSVWPETLTVEDAATYLLGPVLGLLLRRKGFTCLHASAVALQGKAILFSGAAGAGKSTTAAAMAKRGHAVLADDIVATVERDGVFFAVPAFPYISLWPESVEMLYGPEVDLPRFSASFPKQRLPLGYVDCPFQESALPVGAIFILDERTSNPMAPYVERLSAQEGLMALIANSYATKLLDKRMRAIEFESFGRILNSVPVQRLHVHRDPNLLDQLCDAIEYSCSGLRAD